MRCVVSSNVIRTPAALASGPTKSSAAIKFSGSGAFLYHLSKQFDRDFGSVAIFERAL
jgi:hypothetical protein